MKRLALCGFLLACCVVPAGCGDEKTLPTEVSTEPDPTATFTRVQNEVFTRSCALSGCHAGPASQAQQGLVLSSGEAYRNIVLMRSTEKPEVRLVMPNDPKNSYLWRKITGNQQFPFEGVRMPQNGSITEAQYQLVTDWIRLGAPNN